MSTAIEHRLAHLILNGDPFTADDLTFSGSLALDGTHTPNAKQNGIGSLFQAASKRGHIRFTGEVRHSTAPHRKGGTIRVWVGTEKGCRWAREILAQDATWQDATVVEDDYGEATPGRLW